MLGNASWKGHWDYKTCVHTNASGPRSHDLGLQVLDFRIFGPKPYTVLVARVNGLGFKVSTWKLMRMSRYLSLA